MKKEEIEKLAENHAESFRYKIDDLGWYEQKKRDFIAGFDAAQLQPKHKCKPMEAKAFYEKFKKDKGLNFCEGLDDVFELMKEYSNHKISEANERIKEMEKAYIESVKTRYSPTKP